MSVWNLLGRWSTAAAVHRHSWFGRPALFFAMFLRILSLFCFAGPLCFRFTFFRNFIRDECPQSFQVGNVEFNIIVAGAGYPEWFDLKF